LLGVLPTTASAGPLDAKQQQAANLEARIRQQGSRLSMADEDYNEARVQREQVQAKASSARSLVVAAEQRWAALRSQLGRRARLLYMHPGAALDALFGARSLGEVARARVYGAEVLLTDTALVMQAERARHEVLERAKALDALKEQAAQKEDDLAAKRVQVERELSAQRALLGEVKGDIAEIIAAERARQAAAAAAAAAKPPTTSAAKTTAATGVTSAAPTVVEPTGPPPAVRASAGKAVETARAQIGKPYEFGAAGPSSFDCSGLTMYAWNAAGVSLPHSSRAQFDSLPHVARSDLQPGDLVFFGSPIHHVGIYEGGGIMINAPETGENVRRDSIARSDYVGAARP
jgi:cell wall-associated NlpC family hydrolase